MYHIYKLIKQAAEASSYTGVCFCRHFFVLILLVDGLYMPPDAVFIFLRLLTNQLFRRQSVL